MLPSVESIAPDVWCVPLPIPGGPRYTLCYLLVGAKGVVVSGLTPRGKDQQWRAAGATLDEHRGRRARKGRKIGAKLSSPVLAKPDLDPASR